MSRAIALLKAFDDVHPEWSLSELCDQLGLNKSTTHRILAALESESLVRRTDGGSYRLGPELIGLGGCALRANEVRRAARTELEALARSTNETVTLEILSGRHVLILDEVSHRDLLGMTQDIGARLPLHATSSGKLLLAYLPQAERNNLIAPPLAALTPHTITDVDELHRQLEQIVAQGYATASGELDLGFVAAAAPVYNAEHKVTATVSVGGPALRLTPANMPEVTAALLVTARRISRNLGHRPG